MKVWVNGTFDVLHIGHIRLLEYASKLGRLIVGIDTDYRIKEKKGHDRPYNCLEERIEFLSSIKFVDTITVFGSDEELESKIKIFSPDIMVIGDDYRDKKIIGSEYIKEIIFFERIKDKSTTSILNYGNYCNR